MGWRLFLLFLRWCRLSIPTAHKLVNVLCTSLWRCVAQLRYDLCSETYQYYTLPFCEPPEKKFRSEGLGEVLAGDRTVNSLYKFHFAQDAVNSTICTKKLNAKDVEKFRRAVADDFYFQVH
jgi:Endomembrane protein 70